MKKLPEVEWLSVVDVAAYLNVSETTVRRLLTIGELGHYRVGSQYRISPKHVNDYLNKKEKK